MKLKLNQTGSNLASSVTGNVNKACLLLKEADEDWLGEQDEQTPANYLSEVSKMKNAAISLQTAAGGLTEQNNLSVFGIADNVKQKAWAAGFLPVQVQYNPASLTFEGSAGEIIKESAGGNSENRYEQMNTPEETNMRVELFFDAVNCKDAFLGDNARVFTAGDVLQKGKQLYDAGKGKKHSVQETVEIFVGAIVKAQSRFVGFVWNNMVFWGEMFGVAVQYTMFSRDGNPIMAKVTIQIRQDKGPAGKDYESEKYWNKAYQKLFSNVYQGGAVDSVGKWGNLIQL